jgi:hypothetical protein
MYLAVESVRYRFRLSRRRFLATSGATTLALASPPVLADTRAETAGTRTTPDKLLAALESLDG